MVGNPEHHCNNSEKKVADSYYHLTYYIYIHMRDIIYVYYMFVYQPCIYLWLIIRISMSKYSSIICLYLLAIICFIMSFCLLPFFVTVLHLFLFFNYFPLFPPSCFPYLYSSRGKGQIVRLVPHPPNPTINVCLPHLYTYETCFCFSHCLYLSVSLSIISICQSVCLSLYICTILTIYLHMKHVALSLNYAGYEIM